MANRPITEKEKKAWIFSKNLHKDQTRKFVGLPYFDAHVQKVNGIVKQYTRDEDLLIAALLHDTVEDCYEDEDVGYYEIKELFGLEVANIVKELTSDKDEIESEYNNNKTNYLIDKMINMSNSALVIKLADRLQNISDAFTASEKFRNKYFKETIEIISELERHRKTTRIQALLINEIKSKLSNISSIFKLENIKKFSEFKLENSKFSGITVGEVVDLIDDFLIDLKNINSEFSWDITCNNWNHEEKNSSALFNWCHLVIKISDDVSKVKGWKEIIEHLFKLLREEDIDAPCDIGYSWKLEWITNPFTFETEYARWIKRYHLSL